MYVWYGTNVYNFEPCAPLRISPPAVGLRHGDALGGGTANGVRQWKYYWLCVRTARPSVIASLASAQAMKAPVAPHTR